MARFMSILHEGGKMALRWVHGNTSGVPQLSSIPTLLTHVYFLSSNAITKEELECLEKYHDDIIKYSSMVDLQMIWEHHGCR
ncbi:unnamed protein product [Camellia sinensis]